MINKQATLIINRYDSQCINCGEGASPKELKHDTILDWKIQDRPGCGITWENVSTAYCGMEEIAKNTRPDLYYVDFKEVLPTLHNAQLQTFSKKK